MRLLGTIGIGVFVAFGLGCAPGAHLEARVNQLEKELAALKAAKAAPASPALTAPTEEAKPVAESKAEGHPSVTITRAYWFHSKERPTWIAADRVAKDGSGHMLVHVDETGFAEYKPFWEEVDKEFLLSATGKETVRAQAERGFWGSEFYIRIPPAEYAKMASGVAYELRPLNSKPERRWKLASSITIVKP